MKPPGVHGFKIIQEPLYNRSKDYPSGTSNQTTHFQKHSTQPPPPQMSNQLANIKLTLKLNCKYLYPSSTTGVLGHRGHQGPFQQRQSYCMYIPGTDLYFLCKIKHLKYIGNYSPPSMVCPNSGKEGEGLVLLHLPFRCVELERKPHLI